MDRRGSLRPGYFRRPRFRSFIVSPRPAFKDLFREGMTLVEEAASYLDGPGRTESRGLSRPAALAYSTESMRLTTRLMQVASWLLLQRAVNEGELTSSQAQAERVRVKLSRQDMAARLRFSNNCRRPCAA